MAVDVHTKRIYEPPSADDGYRVLIDRIWPRGVSKQNAHLDEWAKELAPSAELRKWFNHQPDRFDGFRERYRAELQAHKEELRRLRRLASERRVTVVYAARDERHSNAAVLSELLRRGR